MWNFSFVLDGKTDMMSLNPLEMTNFEMMGTIFGIAGVLLTLLRIIRNRQRPHEFTVHEVEDEPAN